MIFLFRFGPDPTLRTTVDSGVMVSVSTKQQLGKGEVLHRTAPAYPSADGSVVWGQSLLIDTVEPWDKFVLTIDLHPSHNLQQHKVSTFPEEILFLLIFSHERL